MLKNHEGKKVPNCVFKTRKNGDWADVSSKDLFSGRKVVVFSLPGAFTPTCSSTHLPRYAELAATFRDNGVDEIVCVSVNDAFVMEAWGENQKIENITLLPDGNGEFTEGMGMLVDKGAIGFGKRSWRYSMLVNDGVVEKMFIEPEKDGDPFEVSDADTMLNFINPKAKLPDEITIISKVGCRFCLEAKAIFKERQMPYEEILLGQGISYKSLRNLSGGKATAPQIFINQKHVGGLDELKSYLKI